MAPEDVLSTVGIHCSSDNVVARTGLYAAFAISSFYIGRLVLSYVRVLLSLFVLPGTSVSSTLKKRKRKKKPQLTKDMDSFQNLGRKGLGS
jgi:hypothetical protein